MYVCTYINVYIYIYIYIYIYVCIYKYIIEHLTPVSAIGSVEPKRTWLWLASWPHFLTMKYFRSTFAVHSQF